MGSTGHAQGLPFNSAGELHLKSRNPVIAFFLSLFFPGLGQLYNGQGRKYAGVLALSLVWCLVIVFYDPFSTFRSAAVYLGISLAFQIVIAGEAAFAASRLRAVELKQFNRVWVYILAAVVPVILFGLIPDTSDNYRSFNVSASSMEPTLRLGERVMVQRAGADKSVLSRGEIIIFRSGFAEKKATGKEKFWIKRVVGLPGETLEIRNRVIFINGRALEGFSYGTPAGPSMSPGRKADNFGPLEIPPDSYFVLGDSFLKSYDSMFFGTVASSEIIGKAVYIAWSDDWDRMGKSLDQGKP